MPVNVPGWFRGAVFFGIAILTYVITRAHQCVEASNDVINHVSAVCARVPASLSLSGVVLVGVVLLDLFPDFFAMCRDGHPIYTGGFRDSVLYGWDGFLSDTYKSILSL